MEAARIALNWSFKEPTMSAEQTPEQMAKGLSEALAAECRLYAEHLRTWTLSADEVGEARPLRDLLRDVAEALSPDRREQFRQGTDEAYDRWARKIGKKYPWLHPDYDPESSLWQMRRDRANRRILQEQKP
jgi:hypothetical protein